MNHLIKNMEAAFVIALGLACSASLVWKPTDRAASSTTPVSVSVGNEGKMAVIVVKAKRLTAAQKEQSLREERALSAMSEQARDRT